MNDITDPPQTNTTESIPEWLKQEVAEYDLDLAHPPKTILDIGANVGAYTLRCAKRWPDAEIHAYEPVKENADQFRTHCADLRHTHFHQAAVRRFKGQDMILRGDMGAVFGFHQLGRTMERGPYVECISSAELPEADLVKIDTEGCEVEILERLNTDKTQAIVCEIHRVDDREAIKSICLARGFELHTDCDGLGVMKFVRPGTIKKVKLYLGIPVYQKMDTQFNTCLLELQGNKPCEIVLKVGQGDGVMRTRNVLTHDFLTNTDCTHMLQIDCDLIFAPHHVARIVSHDVDVVGGFYPKKQEGPLEWVINTWPGPVKKRSDGLHKVAYIGTGFMAVKRHVFEKMATAYPQIAFGADYGSRDVMHEYWPMGVYCYQCGAAAGPNCNHSPKHRRYLSEDWYFCQRWMDMGGEIFGDTKVPLKHIGPAIFPLLTQQSEMANPKPAEADKLPGSDTAEPVQQTQGGPV